MAAIELYTASTLFRYCRVYAMRQNPDKIFILSAEFGLLRPDTPTPYYDRYLTNESREYKTLWYEKVNAQIEAEGCFTPKSTVTILAGKDYYEGLHLPVADIRLPLKGLRMGERLQRLRELCVDA